MAAGVRHVRKDGGRQRQPVQAGGVKTSGSGRFHVTGIDGQQLVRPLFQQAGQFFQRGRLGRRGGAAHHTRGRAGPFAQPGHLFRKRHRHLPCIR